ncbi:thioredoxin fold domain-containing protein [Pseudobdellovibrio sp. HCB154]|uniref:thioredoxin fold domain-containing protein n=1 Tax=Pseudobdellovibrio sp. HCB154 TaxID=3386277 RepID=UPI003916D6E9
MTKLFVVLGLIFSTHAFAEQKTKGAVTAAVENKEIVLTVKKGFHFNDKAPASVVFDDLEAKHKPLIKTEQKFTFKVLENTKKAKLNYYVCDDAKTVCEPHDQVVELTAKRAATDAAPYERAVASDAPAKKYDKITLLKFSAPWCPACIRLKSETMNKPPVKALLKKVNFEEINIDLVENEKISDQYGVKAIPTVILVNEQGEEIKRWLDYQPAKSFAPELQAALKETQSINQLVAKAEAGDEKAATTLGYNSYSKMIWKDAAKWFSFSKGAKELNYKLASEISYASDEMGETAESKKAYQQALEKGFTLSSSVLDQTRWKLDYLEQLKEQERPIETDAIKALQFQLAEIKNSKDLKGLFAKSTLGDNENFEKAEVLDMTARLYKLTDDKENAKKIQGELASAVDKVKLSTKLPGQMISAIWYYGQAGVPEKSEPLLKQLIKAYPKTYVYYQRYASFLTKQKRHDEALAQANLALEFKEGNEPQLSLAKVKILKELGKKDEAIILIDSALKITEAHPTKYKRTQTALTDIKKNLLNPEVKK